MDSLFSTATLATSNGGWRCERIQSEDGAGEGGEGREKESKKVGGEKCLEDDGEGGKKSLWMERGRKKLCGELGIENDGSV